MSYELRIVSFMTFNFSLKAKEVHIWYKKPLEVVAIFSIPDCYVNLATMETETYFSHVHYHLKECELDIWSRFPRAYKSL